MQHRTPKRGQALRTETGHTAGRPDANQRALGAKRERISTKNRTPDTPDKKSGHSIYTAISLQRGKRSSSTWNGTEHEKKWNGTVKVEHRPTDRPQKRPTGRTNGRSLPT